MLPICLLFANVLSCFLVSAIEEPVRVYILAGQSNMEGKGSIKMLKQLVNDSLTRPAYEHWVDDDGNWISRDDVKVYFPGMRGEEVVPLSVGGLGNPENRFGPDLEFGKVVGDTYDGNTLIIKAAWGGKDLGVDFRPPSRGKTNYTTWEPGYKLKESQSPLVPQEAYGKYYELMISSIHSILQRIEVGEVFPGHDSWELRGFVWWQGWNDLVYARKVDEYEENLKSLIREVRKDLDEPDLPFVIGEMGQQGLKPNSWLQQDLIRMRRYQRAPALSDEFRDRVRCVMTSTYALLSGDRYDGNYHYYGRADTVIQVGRAFGQTMIQLHEDIVALSFERSG